MEAPPVARQGEPKKPWKKRRAISPEKSSTTAVPMDMMRKMPNVTM